MYRSYSHILTLAALALTTLPLASCDSIEPAPAAAQSAAASAGEAADSTRMYMVRVDGYRNPLKVGAAGFVPMGERTLVTVGVRGGPRNTRLRGFIQEGASCDSLDPAALPLRSIHVAGTTLGQRTTEVEVTISEIFDGRHLVTYYDEHQPEHPLFCGSIPRMIQSRAAE